MSIISCTSPSPSVAILPISRVTNAPSAAFACRSRSPSCRITSPRLGAGILRHTTNAASARATIWSYSSTVTCRTDARADPSIGLTTDNSGPLPIQSPLNPPTFCSAIPSSFSTSCIDKHLFVKSSFPVLKGARVNPKTLMTPFS